jgi:hypothetical protein
VVIYGAVDHVREEGSDGRAAEEHQWLRRGSGAWIRVVTFAPALLEQHGHGAFGQEGQERYPFVAHRLHAVLLEFDLLIYVYA